MAKEMLVFQDLVLRANRGSLQAVRTALLDHTAAPWKHADEREKEISVHSAPGHDVVAFTREKGDGIEAVGLLLWSEGASYKVTNIVPRDVGELGFEAYNAALQDFVSRVVEPARQVASFQIAITPERQSLNDWVSSDMAEALSRFSSLANKSTGSSHPLDRQRWFAFLFLAHRSSEPLDTDRLMRWLVEVENWPEEKAHDLAIQYEFGLDLLKAYDSRRA
ncbi:hypothetical protein [Methylocystis sp. JR02]|uniref:hypothetical protein n=1 Tax=Methylocystis sp. JR02 TaxID=3046284 RepID=UPI0024B9D23C|nr:hypothetical protein [Methylocystis sp. JR02]MDJ0448819.1 hypothetical protein [Methylocystis sp. JR02]